MKWSAGKELSFEIKAPVYVTAEVTQSPDQSKLMLHLVNYYTEKDQLVKDIDVSLKIPNGKQVQEMLLLSPDREGTESLPFTAKDGRAVFKVPRLDVYDLVVVKL